MSDRNMKPGELLLGVKLEGVRYSVTEMRGATCDRLDRIHLELKQWRRELWWMRAVTLVLSAVAVVMLAVLVRAGS